MAHHGRPVTHSLCGALRLPKFAVVAHFLVPLLKLAALSFARGADALDIRTVCTRIRVTGNA